MLEIMHEVLDNAALLISLCVLYELSLYIQGNPHKHRKYLDILLLCLIGVLVMNSSWVIVPGVIMDARVTFVGLIALTFSPLAALSVALFLILYRVFLGGIGMFAGVLIILLGVMTGYIWKKAQMSTKIKNAFLNLYVFGLILHLEVMVAFQVLPKTVQALVYLRSMLPIMLIYPFLTVLVGMILQIQRQRHKEHQELQSAEKKFRLIFEKANVGINFVNRDGTITASNQKFCDLVGYTQDELRGISFKDITYEEDLQNDTQHLDDLLRGITTGYCIDKRYVCKDKSLLWINLTVSLLQLDEDQAPILMRSVVDISERKNAELSLQYQYYHDQLTNLYNRRYFDDNKTQIDQQENYPLSIILVSINGLSLFNEVFGFKAGDQVVVKGVQLFLDHFKDSELIYRMDGDKFMILQPHKTLSETQSLIQGLRDRFSAETIENIELSISVGSATKNKVHVEIEKVLNIASDNLKRDKLIDKSSMASKTIDIIMNSLYEKNKREMLHSKRVSQLCELMAVKMQLSENEISKIKIAGLMHDIGKIGISDSILDKTESLTPAEWQEIQRHCEAGYRILSSAKEFSEIADYILAHHERWDGKGYPKGLKEDEIPLCSRIIALADSFDAMTSNRAYRKGLTSEKALIEIGHYSGIQYDPTLTKIFQEVIRDSDILDIN